MFYLKKKPYAHNPRLMRIRAYAMLMRKAYARLMREAYAGCLCTAYAGCLCTMFVRRLNFSLRPQAAYAAPYAALMQGLCTDQTERRPDERREKQRQRETEAEKERQRKRQTHRETHSQQSGPPSLMQTAYAHKPKSEFILLPMRSLVFALRCSVLAYAGLCESYVVRGIALCRLMRRFL